MEKELERGMERDGAGDGRGKQYVVKREDGFCVKIWMQSQIVCPGESFAAEIDFSQSQIPCKKLTIFLQEREFLTCTTPPHPSSSSISSTSFHPTTKAQTAVQETHATSNVDKIETRIYIPPSCRLQFMGGLVGREWAVCFGFEVAEGEGGGGGGWGDREEDVVFSCPLEVVVKEEVLGELWKRGVCGKVTL